MDRLEAASPTEAPAPRRLPEGPSAAPADPRVEVSRRLEAARSEVAGAARLDDRAGNLRLVVFLSALAAGFLAWRGTLPWWPAGASAAGFVALLIWHGRVMTRRRRLERVVAFHEKGLARLDGKWQGAGSTGDRFFDEDHPYAADLDLFGVGSMFERLCAARTPIGESTLAGWLLAPATPEAVAERQSAVVELRDRLGFREDLSLLGDDVGADVHAEPLGDWGASPRRSVPTAVRLGVFVLALATFASLVGLIFGVADGRVVLALLAAESAVAYASAKRTTRGLEGVEDRSPELATLAALLARIERENFTSPPLEAIRRSVVGDGPEPASRRIARLSTLVRWIEARHDVYFALFASTLLWKTQFGFAVEAWREREGKNIRPWLDAVGELEAFASLAGYAFENPADPFPSVTEEGPAGPILEGEGVGHPLLSASACVRNSLRLGSALGDAPSVLAISGSNMSGKSTFLRTVGLNAVLAQAGAPVRAGRFALTPVSVGGTLKVHDSLQEGRSRFYAEILRLKRLVDMASARPRLFFLIDEVLHGTNSADRLEGAGAVIRALIDRGAIGLFTTHDLALAEVAGRIGPTVSNVHFADHVGPDGRLAFDYRMRPGVVRQSNALALMRAVGLEV